MKLSRKKYERLQSLSTNSGVIAALAMDQRKSLRRMIAESAGVPLEAISDVQLKEFKSGVTAVLSQHATAILLDPEYGLEASRVRSSGCGLLMTYEADGYENPRPHRMLALMPHASVQRLHDWGAGGVKILLSWAPDDDAAANDEKRAMIEQIGAECEALDLPFFLEPVVYDPLGGVPGTLEYAKRKPEWVVQTMEEFSRDVYRVDVLKVEFPVMASFVEGSTVFCGQRAQTMAEALAWYRAADAAARRPYIYLSAGVNGPEFLASLTLAAESKARFSGVLCGRANWQGGVPAFVRGGLDGLVEWLETEGTRNIQAVNVAVRQATPWMDWVDEE